MNSITRLAARTTSYAKGRFLLDPGENGADICFLISGTARVFRITEDGREITLAVRHCQSGPLLLSACIKGVGIEFLTDSELCLMSADEYLEASSNDFELRQHTIAQVMDYVEQCHQKIEDLALRSVEARLARQLVVLAEQENKGQVADAQIEVQITQSRLANFVAASRPSVNIALQKMQQRGLLKTKGGMITIPSLINLRAAITE